MSRKDETPSTLLGIVERAILLYMRELGRIAWELERAGRFDYVKELASVHPGTTGRGQIVVGRVGDFRQLSISFRGAVERPDGRKPAVLVTFYLLPPGAQRPMPGRLLIPIAGMEPSFRASTSSDADPERVRDYGWRPRLMRTRSILELLDDGEWSRLPNDINATHAPRQRRPAKTTCDASCGMGSTWTPPGPPPS